MMKQTGIIKISSHIGSIVPPIVVVVFGTAKLIGSAYKPVPYLEQRSITQQHDIPGGFIDIPVSNCLFHPGRVIAGIELQNTFQVNVLSANTHLIFVYNIWTYNVCKPRTANDDKISWSRKPFHLVRKHFDSRIRIDCRICLPPAVYLSMHLLKTNCENADK